MHIKPFADLRRIDFVQVLDPQGRRRSRRRGRRAGAVILSPGAFVRVGGLLLLAVVLQVSASSQMPCFGGHADLVRAVGRRGGLLRAAASPGCATGFAAGFLLDLATGATMGASSLVLTAVGYGVGRFREVRDPSHGLMPIAVGAAATGGWVRRVRRRVASCSTSARAVSPLVIRDMIVTVLLNALLALPVFPAVRRLLRPVLAVDPLERAPPPPPPREAGPLGLRGLEI